MLCFLQENEVGILDITLVLGACFANSTMCLFPLDLITANLFPRLFLIMQSSHFQVSFAVKAAAASVGIVFSFFLQDFLPLNQFFPLSAGMCTCACFCSTAIRRAVYLKKIVAKGSPILVWFSQKHSQRRGAQLFVLWDYLNHRKLKVYHGFFFYTDNEILLSTLP